MTGNTDMHLLLTAYADGELDEPGISEVESWLAANPSGHDTLAMHRETTALLKAAFSENLYAAGIEKLITPPLSPRSRDARPGDVLPFVSAGARPRGLLRYGWAMAASVLMALAGYAAGAAWPGLLISERTQMLTEIAEYHAVYSRETVHLVEVPATQMEHLKKWLGSRVKQTLVVPDFTEAGLTLAGGRLVVLDGQPVAELMYTRAKGLPIAFCVFHRQGTPAKVRIDQRGVTSLASWGDGSHTYFVVGEADVKLIEDLAARVQRQL